MEKLKLGIGIATDPQAVEIQHKYDFWLTKLLFLYRMKGIINCLNVTGAHLVKISLKQYKRATSDFYE